MSEDEDRYSAGGVLGTGWISVPIAEAFKVGERIWGRDGRTFMWNGTACIEIDDPNNPWATQLTEEDRVTSHACQLPAAPEGSRAWRCPGCQTRYVWSKRMIGRQMREGWQPMRDDFETRRLRNDAEFKRFGRWAIAWGVVASVVTVALIVWIVLRIT